ncbi:F-box protein CPR1-like [Corylus avellana]|uniref:F-box protein CPR1-like n=1 Tax=Corylus avellana TaxID=13451 RepID=UPI00286A3CC1|nr:F-box protein CPR1-like [Corylus avellana]
MTGYLPEDLLREILLRLPVKHLVRFRSVSKSWSALLKSRDFTTTHLNRSANHGCHLLVYGLRDKRDSLSLISGKALDVAVKIKTPEKGMVMGSCNGLVCLYNGKKNITLWNPATREHKILPTLGIDPNSPNTLGIDDIVGFGYHLNDYKVVRILYFDDEPSDSAQVEVYSTSTGCWRVFDAIVPCVIRKLNSSVILKGVPYWIGCYFTSNIRYRESVVYFDMGKEVFRHVHTPSAAEGSYCTYGKKLGVLNESLAIICNHCTTVSNFVDIWVMMKDDDGVDHERWIKVQRIGPFPSFRMLLGCWRDGVLVWQNDNDELLVYDPNINAVNKLSPYGVVPTLSRVFTYMESLVPL